MKVSSLDITKALVTELRELRERYIQFQTRVKAANEAARSRDEEARKQNAILTERIVELEKDLKEAKKSINVCTVLFLFHVDNPELMIHLRPFVSSVNYFQLSKTNSTRSKLRSKHLKRSDPTLPCSKRLYQRLTESILWKAASEKFSTWTRCVVSPTY